MDKEQRMTKNVAHVTNVAHRTGLADHLEQCLEVARFADYGPNGLQVEGRAEVRRLVSGVTASLALIEAAADAGADAILVHHGLFWRGQDGRVTGWMKQRLATLLRHDINLYAYHLPLDAHPTLGNNAQLGLQLGLVTQGTFGDKALGVIGRPVDGACTLEALAAVSRAMGGWCGASRGVPAARRAGSNRRSQRGPMST
jgi:putative NIF3 family GTP cyclohydrolase 1 type 2